MANNIYTSKVPHLDLHGETTAFVEYLINTFIKDNIKQNNKFIVIIHGWNSRILMKETHRVLKRDKRVIKFYLDAFNIGQTIVELDI